ncbi:xanthine dehydrogenase family protein molybdopterin-binding subunit [Tumebacillus flagellatus]|uniref:Aldehyde oxidase n=1 Tax=Tumebacillus flagellatus TaxID=1157490 RepID=A0A074LWK2_9BACL|nr:xanthine dehydrogenase family protein molybdopterin-binding subunit [Tumebacillus flagellatus]KEO85259.1 aldehyde oxidase [Tumebacillus flagellatus]
MESVGKSVPRKESFDKVEGRAKYTRDLRLAGMLHGKLVTSPHAHAKIRSIDAAAAAAVPGVRGIVTGADCQELTGELLADRPVLAYRKVRYYGEPVAVVIADDEQTAWRAAGLVHVEYEVLPVVSSPSRALLPGAPLLHEEVEKYKRYGDVYPVPGMNIGNHLKIRKGDFQSGWEAGVVKVECYTAFRPSDHIAMEPRAARAEILPDGEVHIRASTQAPYVIKRFMERYFGLDPGQVVVHVPFVGGGFGAKGAVQLEFIAYCASRAVGGRLVEVSNSREEDMISSPCHIGLEAQIKMAATPDGRLTAAQITLLWDGGAYADMAAVMAKAGIDDCTGPYRIPNVWADSLAVYTNHTYATSFRGFAHPEVTFAIERTMDLLAKKLGMDPIALRLLNAIGPGETTPTQVLLDESNIGNVPACILRLRELMDWESGQRVVLPNGRIRTKGIAALWKTSSTPTDAGAGAVLIFNKSGSVNLMTGVVEIGQGTKTALAQIAAERLTIDPSLVHVSFEVNTKTNPEHWKTVASSSTMMAGRAILEAADDAIRQLKYNAALVLQVSPDELELAEGRVFVRGNPQRGFLFREIAMGYESENGLTVGKQVIGRGSYIVKLTRLDPETGDGRPGPQWSVAAQGVEVEFDPVECRYQVLRAYTVIDGGVIVNHRGAVTQMMGGMSMGLSWATRESFLYDNQERVLNPQLRFYKITHFGENPDMVVDFVQTPYHEGPYGARGIGEYGTIGMAGALANALSVAAGVELFQLPLLPETIWRARGGGSVHDPV